MTITTKIAKDGRVNLYTDGKRNRLERLAKEIAAATIPADTITIASEKGNFTFAGITEEKSEFTGKVVTRTYTFKNLDGATFSMEIGAATPAFVAYREIIKSICDIPFGTAKYTMSPKEAELAEWNRRFELTCQAEYLAEEIKYTEYKLADPAFNTLDSSMLEYKAELQAEVDTLKVEYAAIIENNPDIFNKENEAETPEEAEAATVEVEEYAVSTEAQEAATEAEIELAQAQTAPTVEVETDGSEEDGDIEIPAVIPTDEDDTEDELIDPPNEFLLERIKGNYTATINDEYVHFENHSIIYIDAQSKLGYTFSRYRGKKEFRDCTDPMKHRIISARKIIELYMLDQEAEKQNIIFTDFLNAHKQNRKGFFKAWVTVTFANNRSHNATAYFDNFNEAKAYVDEAKKIFAGMKMDAIIRHDCTSVYYKLDETGTETYDLPNADTERDEILSTPLVTEAAADEAAYCEQKIAAAQPTVELPKGAIEVNSGADAFKLIAPYFPNGLIFSHVTKGFKREDVFSYTDDKETLFVAATCDKGNRRIEAVEVIDTNESGSRRKPLTVYIKPAAEFDDVTAADREIEIQIGQATKNNPENVINEIPEYPRSEEIVDTINEIADDITDVEVFLIPPAEAKGDSAEVDRLKRYIAERDVEIANLNCELDLCGRITQEEVQELMTRLKQETAKRINDDTAEVVADHDENDNLNEPDVGISNLKCVLDLLGIEKPQDVKALIETWTPKHNNTPPDDYSIADLEEQLELATEYIDACREFLIRAYVDKKRCEERLREAIEKLKPDAKNKPAA